jgi:glycosyltransferase involved in cell wall biosynthesis
VQPNLVSVIMPVYNGERFLRQAIDSLLAQTYPEWELVAVDDGSSDSTASIIQSYSDARLGYTYQENRGQAAALNRGLELARGEFVTTLDCDDWLTPESLAARVAYLRQHAQYGVVYGDGLYCNVNGEPVLQFTDHMPAGITGDVYDTLIVSPFYGTGATVMIRQPALQQNGIRYDEAIVWCQDWDFYIRLAERVQFGFVPDLTINYRLHDTGMTTSMPGGRRLESLLRLRQKVLASERFQSTAINCKAAFFYDYLVKDLSERVEEQSRVMTSDPFTSLPPAEQSRLLRLAANAYLLQDAHKEVVRQWLRLAWRQTPFGLKTASTNLLYWIHPSLARKAVQYWQRGRSPHGQVSPFELAQVAQS